MTVKAYNPTSPGRRGGSVLLNEDLTKSKPEKSLVVALRKRGGRNNQGKITVRHRGGGAKRMIRIIDFKRDKFDIPGKVAAIESLLIRMSVDWFIYECTPARFRPAVLSSTQPVARRNELVDSCSCIPTVTKRSKNQKQVTSSPLSVLKIPLLVILSVISIILFYHATVICIGCCQPFVQS